MTIAGPRLAYCCTFVPEDRDQDMARRMNAVGVTMSSLAKAGPGAHARLLAAVAHNLRSVALQVARAATRPPLERALRIVSSLLPGYNNAVWRPHYDEPDLRALMEEGFPAIGQAARGGGVRLSFHPDQFCTLATLKESAQANAVGELEYHADMVEMMGFSGWHLDGAHVNVHGGARAAGIEGFRSGFGRLSRRARDLVTIENDEVSFGLDSLLPLADELPIVLDLHHHWIASRGEYLAPDDPRIRRIAESWRGARPMSHVSVSREDLLVEHDPAARPDFSALAAGGLKAGHLRRHSDMMWNAAVNELVAEHLAWTDFEVEAKAKNLASAALARFVEGRSPAVPASSRRPGGRQGDAPYPVR